MTTKHFKDSETPTVKDGRPRVSFAKKLVMFLGVFLISGIGTPFMLNTVFGCNYPFNWNTILAFTLLPIMIRYIRNYLR